MQRGGLDDDPSTGSIAMLVTPEFCASGSAVSKIDAGPPRGIVPGASILSRARAASLRVDAGLSAGPQMFGEVMRKRAGLNCASRGLHVIRNSAELHRWTRFADVQDDVSGAPVADPSGARRCRYSRSACPLRPGATACVCARMR